MKAGHTLPLTCDTALENQRDLVGLGSDLQSLNYELSDSPQVLLNLSWSLGRDYSGINPFCR